MPNVFLPLSKDSDATRVLSKALEVHGWTVWPGSQNLYIEADVMAIEEIFDDSDVFLVVWSNEMAGFRWINMLADFAQKEGKLIQFTTADDAVPEKFQSDDIYEVPELTGQAATAWPDWDAFKSHLLSLVKPDQPPSPPPSFEPDPAAVTTRKAPIRPIRETGEPEDFEARYRERFNKARLHVAIEPTPAPPRVKEWAIASIVGLALLGGAGLYATNLMSEGNKDTATSSPEMQTLLSRSEADWSAIDQSDPVSIRTYIAGHPDAPDTYKARHLLQAMEDDAWLVTRRETDALIGLEKLAAFEKMYPDHLRDDAIYEMRAEMETIKQEAGAHLTRLGFFHADNGSITDENLRQAVQAYENQLGLPAGARIDAALVTTLKAAANERDRLNSKLESFEAAKVPRNITAESNVQLPSPDTQPPAPTPQTRTPEPELEPQIISNKPVTRTTRAETPPAPLRLQTQKDCKLCPTLIVLPSGKFQMGDATGNGAPDEKPLRQVTINSFAMGKMEVTFEQWDACHAAGACKKTINDLGWGRGERPVIGVSWYDTQEYTQWLSEVTGHTYRLPSEAEWEYAARAGNLADYSFGNDPAQLCDYGNGADQSTEKTYSWSNMRCNDGVGRITSKVGRYKPNAWQLHDMHGNVWEWVSDCHHNTYQGAPRTQTSWDTSCNSGMRILRGGAFSVQPNFLRSAYRYAFDPAQPTPFFGFRVARDIQSSN